MPSLKDLRNRIASVKATQKITKAMQMVAAAKLRRAQTAAEAARPYAERMESGARQSRRAASPPAAPQLLAGTGKDDMHLLVVATAERGLCGAFNSSIVRLAREHIAAPAGPGQDGQDPLRRQEGLRPASPPFEKQIVELIELRGLRQIGFDNADRDRQEDHRAVRRRRVRRRDAVLLAIQVGDRADPDGAAADPGADRRQ